MSRQLVLSFVLLLSALQWVHAFSLEENFLLIDDANDEVVLQMGANIHERISPCSTFKIALSLIGFDAGILKDEWTPIWDFQEGYVAYKESWKTPQSPRSWMQTSCIWYSQRLAMELGVETIITYLNSMEYGNQDISGGLTEAWLNSSLKISPAEQVKFIQNMIQGNLRLKSRALQLTKSLLFLEELEGGWKLFGKRGYWSSDEENRMVCRLD